MTTCWICRKTEADTHEALQPDGAHRSCTRPQPVPSSYVAPPGLDKLMRYYELGKNRGNKRRGIGGQFISSRHQEA